MIWPCCFCFRLLVPSIDSNKDGMVDHDELETWMRHKQAPWDTGKEDVGEMFRSADRNFDHVVDWEEYSFRRYGFHSNGRDVFRGDKSKTSFICVIELCQ